jgi:hypothetical protein
MSSSREDLSDHDLLPVGRSGMSLTVSGCGLAVYPPGATFGPRRLQDFEFVWLLQGTAEQWPLRTRCAGVGPSVTLVASPSSTRSIPSSLTEIVQGGVAARFRAFRVPAHW